MHSTYSHRLSQPASPSPLRHASTASSNSSTYSRSSADSFTTPTASGHKRGYSETVSPVKKASDLPNSSGAASYQNARQSLRPLRQAPVGPPPRFEVLKSPEKKPLVPSHARTRSVPSIQTPPTGSMAPSRSDSVRHAGGNRTPRSGGQHISFSSSIETPELQELQKSHTPQLRTLSKFAATVAEDDFSIKAPEQEVTGLHGRRKLQRGNSVRTKRTGWAGRTWMDQQRQFLQAYEYLCHIGEAKEWLETVMGTPLPPIVALEDSLRNGVTLAELVQSLSPGRSFRIFRHERLQFRHSDNIAIFFRFLEEIELPDLFWFELVDLYERKNVPKVIYCIHALSWLLFRKGVTDFRIGHLVGQLQFEDHELEATQKALDSAGISLPNFSSMGASFGAEPEPEPEPVETDEERMERELAEQDAAIADFQSQLRGAMVRLRLGDEMQQIWDVEDLIVALQAKIRGDFTREISQYRLSMRRFAINLQSAARAYIVRHARREEETYWQAKEKDVLKLQNLVRGKKARAETRHIRTIARKEESGIRQLQAAIRGALQRQSANVQMADIQLTIPAVTALQTVLRGALAKKRIQAQVDAVQEQRATVDQVQAAIRGMFQRRALQTERTNLRENQSTITLLQAAIRAAITRKVQEDDREDLRDCTPEWTLLQAQARGGLVRRNVETKVQTASCMAVDLQARVRGYLQRQNTYDLLCELNECEDNVVAFQSIARGLLCRSNIGRDLVELEEDEGAIVELQAIIRKTLVQTHFAEKKKFFRENMEKVIKIQSFVRARQAGEAYKTLMGGKNPPVGTVKNFVHLLNDSDFDFDEEIEFERLRKTVVQQVRQNELAEQFVDELDVKIALLVKNKITLDEVVKHQRHFGGHFGSLLGSKEISSRDPALNRNSRKKLEHYQELFFLLQTQPQYLARLFKRLREQAISEQESKRVELLVIGVFGFAQKRREEYYLAKLIVSAIQEEVNGCDSIQDYLRGSFFWMKILNNRMRSPQDRKYLRELLSPVIKDDILSNEALDLESDPMQIYRSALNNEELRTGQRSRRRADIPREEAIKDPETRETFIHHLQDLRDIADHFFNCLEANLHKMPYTVRYIAQQMVHTLRARFPQETPASVLAVVGNWIWKSYVQPALLAPDTWGVVDRGLSHLQKRNLGEVAKVIGQIAAGKLFGGDNVYLQPINPYISEALVRIEEIWSTLITVRPAESHFDIDEFNDLYSRTKPTLYIKLADIFDTHRLVTQHASTICGPHEDPLKDVLRELGSAKTNEHDMVHVSSGAITLTLNPKFHEVEDPNAAINSLFMETKRCVLYIIRVQSGAHLLDIMVKPITMDDEDRWHALIRDELAAERSDDNRRGSTRSRQPINPYEHSSSLLDVTALSYTELKRTALENILALEKTGKISRSNQYQDLLNAIALDIRTKHRRRVQRSKEMNAVRGTLTALQEKANWLDSQLGSYNDYIEQAMITLQQKGRKKRFLLPFTRQYNHERELQKSGRAPRFGSFKYSARNLADKGVLVSWAGYTERQWDKLNITISSDEVGVFHIEGSVGSMMIPGAATSIPLDALLQAQFQNSHYINMFGPEGGEEGKEAPLKLNLNLLVHLVMKKFYSTD